MAKTCTIDEVHELMRLVIRELSPKGITPEQEDEILHKILLNVIDKLLKGK